ncbi:polyprenyl synthetase family protein [Streptomyces sp. NA04227]|nr:polyprenyl synthetase family protein [Streptomyces sp. NA04227]
MAVQLTTALGEGKRMRAAFCYWGWRATGQPDSEAMVKAAAAMEILHAAAVVHDDLVDESAVRRGVPTAHIALLDALDASLFADEATRTAGARNLAMLVGDLLMSWAGQLFTECGLPGAYLARARPLWATLARELIAGECLEILRTRAVPEQHSSLKIIRYKTAKYTVEHPLHIGALLGGAPRQLLYDFSEFGLALGEAFQLRDDLLGVFGDPCETGKSALDDLSGAKPTVLLALALSQAAAEDRVELRRLIGRPDLGEPELETVRAIMVRSGARGAVEELITERAETALKTLDQLRIPDEPAAALRHLVTATVARTS